MPIAAVPKEASARDGLLNERRQKVRRAHDKRRAAIESLGEWLSEQYALPLFLLSDTLTLIYWNDSADRAFKRMRWVRQCDRQLEIADPDLAQRLAQALSRWVKPAKASLRLTSGACTLEVTALQVRQPQSRIFAIKIPQTEGTAASHESLMESFGLSKSEAEVTLLIYNGGSRASVAAARKIALDTVKTHLARIFRKLEVDSQQRLIRKVSDLLAGGREMG